MNKRLIIAIITGAILGIFCIIGVGIRLGFAGNELFLAATWFNRVVMGFVIGLAGNWQVVKSKNNYLYRGALIGLVISFAFYFSTGFVDLIGFVAGIIYGIIIDWIATKYSKK